MKTIAPCFLLFIVFSISSCCPGYWVALQNVSDTTRIVKVVNLDSSELKYKDFVYTSNIYHPILFKSLGRRKLPITKDSAEKSYTFLLPKGKKVFLTGGLGGPEYKPELMIVNGEDTIPISGNSQTKRKEHRLIYTTSYTNIIK